MTRSLGEWLAYQETTHLRGIELGLGRVRRIWEAMGSPRPAPLVITVGGTNGKGSTVAFLEAMCRAAGHRVGCYTSPHLLRYNERVRLDGTDVDDEAFVGAFERIEAARGTTPATYFEFGTLAAIDLMARANLDVAILEVGLGGRLDAVNLIDADVAVVTTVDLDHQEYLGGDRDSIGREKAGIARAGRPAVVGEADPPAGLLDALGEIGAVVLRAGADFHARADGERWHWTHRDGTAFDLPRPSLDAPVQIANAAAAIAAVHALGSRLALPAGAIAQGMTQARVPGRLQRIGVAPVTVVDVGHNPQAARALAAWLDAGHATGRVRAVYGALADKDYVGVMQALGDRVDAWYLAGLDAATPRGLPVDTLGAALSRALPGARSRRFASVADAWAAARADSAPSDTVLLFGSFFVAGAALSSSM